MNKCAVLVAVFLLPTVALADDEWRDWPLGERFEFSAGALGADIDSSASVTQKSPFVQGDDINFEDDLGLEDDESAFFGRLDWRFLKRHSLNLNYYNLDRDGVDNTPRNLTFDGVTFPAGVEVDTNFDITVYEVSYSYSLLFDARKDFYVGLGITAQDLDFAIFATEVPALTVDESFVAPLPTFNAGFDYAVRDNWIVGVKAGYMDLDASLDSDEFDAEIVLVDAGVRWKPASNMGVGVHYSYFSVDGRFEDDEIIADIDLEYKGPRISFDLFF